MKRRLTDANPPGVDPARDVLATTLEHLLLAEIRMMQPNELEDLPQTMCVFRQIAEEVGFAGIERLHHLTRYKISDREPCKACHAAKAWMANTQNVSGRLARGSWHRLVRPFAACLSDRAGTPRCHGTRYAAHTTRLASQRLQSSGQDQRHERQAAGRDRNARAQRQRPAAYPPSSTIREHLDRHLRQGAASQYHNGRTSRRRSGRSTHGSHGCRALRCEEEAQRPPNCLRRMSRASTLCDRRSGLAGRRA